MSKSNQVHIGYYELEEWIKTAKSLGNSSRVYGQLAGIEQASNLPGVRYRVHRILLQCRVGEDEIHYALLVVGRDQLVGNRPLDEKDSDRQRTLARQVWDLVVTRLGEEGFTLIMSNIDYPKDHISVEAWWGDLGFDKESGYYLKGGV